MKNTKLILAASILGASFGNVAVAKETYDERWYVTPTASYILTDDDRQTSRNEYGLGVGLGKAIDENFNLELKAFYNSYEHQETKNIGSQYQWDTFGSTVDALYFFNRDQISPYAVVGAGIMNSKVHNKNAVGLVGEAGLGLAYEVHQNLSIRSDIRYRYNNNFNNHLTANDADEYNDMIVSVGLVIPLGRASRAAPVPVAKPQVTSDDSDNDGVINAIDRCPETKPGVRVNKAGCNYTITLKGVNFQVNSAVLTLNAKVLLDNVAKEIKAYPSKREIEVQGHASSDGNAESNMVLSQKRAEAVAEYLESKGVENDLTAKGYGSSRQISDESSFDGRLKNRRVELVWN